MGLSYLEKIALRAARAVAAKAHHRIAGRGIFWATTLLQSENVAEIADGCLFRIIFSRVDCSSDQDEEVRVEIYLYLSDGKAGFPPLGTVEDLDRGSIYGSGLKGGGKWGIPVAATVEYQGRRESIYHFRFHRCSQGCCVVITREKELESPWSHM